MWAPSIPLSSKVIGSPNSNTAVLTMSTVVDDTSIWSP